MRAIILAGGKGTRLKPYTTVLPKPLMPVDGVPILEVIIRQLVKQGVTRITLTLGHLAKLIEVFFGDGKAYGVDIDYSHEPSPLGTMGPMKLIKDLPDSFLVLNGDILTDLSYAEFFKRHCDQKNIFSISAYRREVNSDFGVLETNGKSELTGFREKPKIPFQVSMGVYAVNREVVDLIPANRPFGFDELMLKMLSRGQTPHVYIHDGFWLDIGRPDDYDQAQTLIGDIKKDLLA